MKQSTMVRTNRNIPVTGSNPSWLLFDLKFSKNNFAICRDNWTTICLSDAQSLYKTKGNEPLGTRRKLNLQDIQETSRTYSERIMYIQFTSCVQGARNNIPLFKIIRQRRLTFLEYYFALLYHQFICKMGLWWKSGGDSKIDSIYHFSKLGEVCTGNMGLKFSKVFLIRNLSIWKVFLCGIWGHEDVILYMIFRSVSYTTWKM